MFCVVHYEHRIGDSFVFLIFFLWVERNSYALKVCEIRCYYPNSVSQTRLIHAGCSWRNSEVVVILMLGTLLLLPIKWCKHMESMKIC